MNTSATWRAISTLTGALAAITPPKADTGSQAWARRCASATSVPDRDPARVGVLDDRHRRLVEVVRRPPGRVGVDVVVVGHLLAVQLLGGGEPAYGVLGAVEGSRLVRVLAVAQHGGPPVGRAGPGRERLVRLGHLLPQPAGHGHVVRGGVRERLRGQALPLGQGEPAGLQRREQRRVLARGGDDGHRGVVLGRAAHHRRSADVDLLHALVRGGAGGDGVAERVEVADQQVERRDAQVGELVAVRLQPQVGQQARRARPGAGS